jgi:hypothetical protein
MRNAEVTYNPVEDSKPKILLGMFPAHVCKWEEGEARGSSIPYNPTFKIHESVKGTTGEDPRTGEEFPADIMAGKEIRGKGVWLCTDGSRSNRLYVEFGEKLGLKFPTHKEGEVDITDVQIIDPEDILGKPCYVIIEMQVANADRKLPEKDQRKFARVTSVEVWPEGKALDPSVFLAAKAAVNDGGVDW